MRLASAFRSSLVLAEQHALRSIALPAISCGVYGYPSPEAANVAASVVRERAWALDEIRVVLFDEATRSAFEEALRSPA
ncbi:putative ADP-ribose binding module [Sandaracinus amylolyticus]|uniref:Putative ADP-ribose binding module n=1 Tax=Sandaracinus amylolyticus TaxID=927083 RepID=A0A0F6SFE0_9BACT|nr:putative ADP-ribose binding module [Sandaracinus amylolyticus]